MFDRWGVVGTFAQASAIYIAFCTDMLKVMKGLAAAGQAVVEGVMMRGRTTVAMSVRHKSGEIRTYVEPLPAALSRGRWVRVPFVRGVFVLLDRAFPSRLAGAFPEGVEVRRAGLAEAVALTRDFLARERPPAHAPEN